MKIVRSSLRTSHSALSRIVRFALLRWNETPRMFKIILITGLCIVLVIAIWFAIGRGSTSAPTESNTARSTPDFQTVLPPHTTIDELGGWQRISPPDAPPTYAYIDHIEDVRVSVSQQLLPANFMENTEQRVKDLAEGFSATTELPLEGSDRLYIGTSARGPQSAIVIKNGLLILIKSEEKISDAAWKQYAASLE